MSGLIYTYALMKSLYDQGKDYLDAFWPFAVKALPAGRDVDPGYVGANLREQFDLDFPLDVLATVFTRAKRKGYVRQRGGRYALTEEGAEYVAGMETDREVEGRIDALVEDMRKYFAEREVMLDRNQVTELLLPFLRSNVAPLVEFFNPLVVSSALSVGRANGPDRMLVEYIERSELERPVHYRTLQDMVLGSLISAILYSREPSEVVEIRRRFRHCQVFLDTNFVFSLLEFHPRELNQAAQELLGMLQKFGFEVKVFDFTVDEICRVIGRYAVEGHRYPAGVAVDTIYSTLARKGWTATDAKEFVINADRILREKGLAVDRYQQVDLDRYEPTDKTLRARIAGYKPAQGPHGQNHDLAAVECIRKLRGKAIRRIEYARACFLTSDVRLSRFSLIEMGHRDNGTVSEVILDRLLTNMLWLKDPDTEPPLKTIIGAYSRDLFVNRQVWDRFYDVLRELRQQETVDDEQVSMLFYHRYIEDVLLGLEEADVEEITPDFVLKQVERASKLSAEKIRTEIEEEFLPRLTEEVSRARQEKDEEWLEKVESARSRISMGAQETARRTIRTGRILLAMLVLVPAGFCLLTGRLAVLGTMGSALSTLSVAVAITIGSVQPLWNRVEGRLFSALYDKRIDDAGLGLLE